MVLRKIALILNNSAERLRMQEILAAAGCEPVIAADGTELLRHLADECDAAFVDSDTIDLWDRSFIRELGSQAPDAPLVLVMRSGRIESYVAMMSTDAWDFISRPVCREAVMLVLHRIDEQKILLEQNRYLWSELEKTQGRPATATRHPRMIEIFRQVSKVARTDASVLILGERGTEKTAVARLIHNASNRKARPFVHVDCTMHQDRLAARLSGKAATELCTIASGGTILLDEVLELAPRLQAMLLRILGDTPSVRFICSTSRDPYEEIENGNFRSDLFFRLNSDQIFLPPLRERTTDIPLLAGELMDQFGVPRPAAGWDELADYDWPGNLSELEAAVRLAAFRTSGAANAADALLPHGRIRRKTRRRFPGGREQQDEE